VSGRYGFRHALYQEVLYQRLSVHGRMRLHRQIGEREEAAYGEHVHEIAAGLAVHFERGQDAARAVQYHTIAAQRAVRVHAHQEALRHITSGLALVPHIADPAVQMHRELVLQTLRGVSLVNTRGFAMPEVVEAYRRAHDLSLSVADLPALAPVLFGLWNFWLVRADLGRASNLAQQLEHLAQQQEEIALQGKAHTTAGQTDTLLGNFTAAFAHFQQGLAVYDEAQHGLFVREYGEMPVCPRTT
jgi:predicted ATPase